MKKLFLIFMMMLGLSSFGQTATWTGAKTFGATLKFLGLPQNNLNTKIMSIDSTGKPGWVDKASISPIPNLEQILISGSATNQSIYIYGQQKTSELYGGDIRIRDDVSGDETGHNSLGFNFYKSFGGGNQGKSSLIANVQNGQISNFLLPIKPTGTYELATTPDDDYLPVYTDNASAIAGGLTVNKKYRTATGQLMITF